MNLLVDKQSAVALARYRSAHGWDCIHIRDVGLDEAGDQKIWKYAKVIVFEIRQEILNWNCDGRRIAELFRREVAD